MLSTTDARNQIVALLNDTALVALSLQETLLAERCALEQQDIDAIDALLGDKSICINKLTCMDSRREELCEAWGFAPGPDRMQDLMRWCDVDELIEDRWGHLLAVAAQSNTINKTNGAIIRARQQQFEASLAVLRGTTPGAETYGSKGEESSDYGRRSITQA
jgi:flagellar biosynthesis/type III secretory pathway chaperone